MLQTVKMSDNSGPETSPKSTSPAAGGTTTPPNPATAGAAGTGQPSPPSAKPPWPNHADDYEVKEIIGVGATAVVHAAYCKPRSSSRHVFTKYLNTNLRIFLPNIMYRVSHGKVNNVIWLC